MALGYHGICVTLAYKLFAGSVARQNIERLKQNAPARPGTRTHRAGAHHLRGRKSLIWAAAYEWPDAIEPPRSAGWRGEP